MIRIELMKEEEVESVAKFISDINRMEESHIGFCGKDSVEIAHSIREDITDLHYCNCFLVAYDQNEMIGVLGFDADLESNSAEIWGPFVKNKWDVVPSMWEKMMALLPDAINSISIFPNRKNSQVLQFANTLSFVKHSDQTVLEFCSNRKDRLQEVELVELKDEYVQAMIQLHDEVFPNTYYSGQQIIERLNENRIVFVKLDNGDLYGYIYVEAEPDYGEGSIEFFAVKEGERGKGIGIYLLSAALTWLFTVESIESITLCVNSTNQSAIHLYKKVGFQPIHDLCFFTKEI